MRGAMTLLFVTAVALGAPCSMSAQGGAWPLPETRADTLLAQGRWSEAEALFYAQSKRAPRNPLRRAALGRFLAMKGALKPGVVLIEEAAQFGLDPDVMRALVAPLRAVLEWRAAAAGFGRDSTLPTRASNVPGSLFRFPLPPTDAEGRPVTDEGVSETIWYDVVERGIGLDSVFAPAHLIGIEVFEALVPSVDMRRGTVMLHANPRSALRATGDRFPVLRTSRGILVLLADERALPLPDALRALEATWWQLDLPHGFVVVRSR